MVRWSMNPAQTSSVAYLALGLLSRAKVGDVRVEEGIPALLPFEESRYSLHNFQHESILNVPPL